MWHDLKPAPLEQIVGIEPTYSDWKSDVITVILYLHGQLPFRTPTVTAESFLPFSYLTTIAYKQGTFKIPLV